MLFVVLPGETTVVTITIVAPEATQPTDFIFVQRLVSPTTQINCPEIDLQFRVSPTTTPAAVKPAPIPSKVGGGTDQIGVLELATGQPRDLVKQVFDKHRGNIDLAIEELMTM